MSNIKHILKEQLLSELNWSNVKFTNITDRMLDNFVNLDFMQYQENWSAPEYAKEYLEDKLDTYKRLSDPVTLYRVVRVKNKKLINTKDLGSHYVLSPKHMTQDFFATVDYNSGINGEPYVMEVQVPLSEINVFETLKNNVEFPHENEITLKNNGRGAKFIKATKLKK